MEDLDFQFTAPETGEYDCKLERAENGVALYRVSMRREREAAPEKAVLSFSVRGADAYSVFDCRRVDRAKSWGGVERTSRLAADLPLMQMISKTGRNRYLFALSDVKTPVSIRIRCDYTVMASQVEISFFTELAAPVKEYACVLRVDMRDIPYETALSDAKAWYASLGYAPAPVPAAAEAPLYSTWYSYLTRVTAADVLRECEAAKALGMDTVIIDDGWQRADGGSPYGQTGDWEPYPEKFPDMAGLVRRLHALGMKAMLWYAVPFMGKHAKNVSRFAGKYLREAPGCDCFVLDPRYPDVRAFIVETYTRAAKAWDLDGFKLDFIDRFRTNGEVREGMDFVSVEDAVECLLLEIRGALAAVRPDMLIEFRQPYSGPVIGAFANMLRAWDCPNDGMTNRVAVLNLRFTAGAAVHADPLRWRADETPEAVAVMLYGTVFGVPQISVRLDTLSPAHRRVLARYLTFWRAHRETLLHGTLSAQSPEALFASAAATLNGEKVVAAFAQNFIDVADTKKAFILNLTASPELILRTAPGTRLQAFDCLGNRVYDRSAETALTQIPVPVGGMATTGEE
ncbi:MAG: alpha-galactosidase [Clostridia bacterium]|nr:alpha-galactosidase [Clostridia bacterium]